MRDGPRAEPWDGAKKIGKSHRMNAIFATDFVSARG
jgi:hypothetical protein